MSGEKSIGSIAIVGGGISGVCLAIALKERNIEVHVYEQAPKFGEIGAGVAFNPAAIRAMSICSKDVADAFNEVATRNTWDSKKTTWFDWVDGHNDKEVGKEEFGFSLKNECGSNAVHRAHFLDNLVHAVPKGVTNFNKHLDTIEELSNGRMQLKFHDGSKALADAVIGCDGIKSSVRAWMMGKDHPCTPPVYSHKYAYRGLIPMERARKELDDELAQNSQMHVRLLFNSTKCFLRR